MNRSRLPEDTDYIVADHAGVIISRGQDDNRLVGSRLRPETLKYMEDIRGSSTYHYVRADGDKRVTTFKKLWLSWEEKPYMYVRAGISFDKVVAESNRNMAYNIALLLPFVIVSFGLAFYIGKRSIADKVSLLESATLNLSEGKLQGKVTDLVKGGELGRLGQAFDDMAFQLKVREESISEHAISLEKEILVRKEAEEALSVKQLQLEELNSFLEERVNATAEQLEEIKELHRRLEEQAICDPLTNLKNRRYLEETLPRELSRAKREGHPLALIMIDIDKFKKVNDTYGHAAGDEVLKYLSTIFSDNARESDIICRYGGEEFLVVLPGMSLDSALQRIEEWRHIFSEQPVKHGELLINVTFSAGIAVYPEHSSDADKLITLADDALYTSKGAGRNCITCAAKPL